MLSKNSLFELIKTLDIHEKRYLMSRGKRAGSENSAYTEMLDVIYKMDEYDENELRKLFASVSKSGKLDVKKHFLYYWILNNLNEYHSTNYQSQKDLQNIQLLLDRSLIGHVQQLISKVKKEIIKSENYLAIIKIGRAHV